MLNSTLSWLVAASVTLAATNLPVYRVSPPTLQEHFDRPLELSGAQIIGFTGTPLGPTLRHLTAIVSGIRPSDRTICVQIMRASGSYSAEFVVKNPHQGPSIAFELNSRAIDGRKMDALAGEMAVRAQVSANDACSDDDVFLPARWDIQPSRSFNVLVNGMGATYIRSQAEGAPTYDCRWLRSALGEPNLVDHRFNAVCPMPQVSTCGSEGEFDVLPADGLSVGPLRKIRVRGSC